MRIQADPRAGGDDVCGRVGTIHRVRNPVFADHTYVQVAPQRREEILRTCMLPPEILEPAE